jgi:hypothetical protein
MPMADSDPTQVPKGAPEQDVDALYGLPLDEFTPRRDALAKELRADGKKDEAAWVKALRKPSAAAWLVNQLARTQSKDAQRVIDSGDAVRAAQDRAIAGKGDRDELAAAGSEHAAAMRALLAKAPGVLDSDGRSPSAASLDRAEETLRAIPLDEEARAGFASGRLTRERRASGLGFALVAAEPAAPSRPAKKPGKASQKNDEERERKARAQAALKEAKARHRDQQRKVTGLERALRAAEREAESARAALARASEALDRARAKASETEAKVEEAEADLKR